MSVWSWLKLTVGRWLIRKAVKGAGWLALAAIAVALWPVSLVAVCGYLSAWLRGWPPVRLYRAAAWALPLTAVWLAAAGIHAARIHAAAGSRAASWPEALWPGRAAVPGWDRLAAADQARVFALAAPAAVPAGLALAGLAWAWRRYAVSAGLGGMMASAPITFDTRSGNARSARPRG